MSTVFPLGSSTYFAFAIARALPSADHASSGETAVAPLNCCVALGVVGLACPCVMAEISHNMTCESFPAETSTFGVVGDQASEEIGWGCAVRVIIGALGLAVGIGFGVATLVGEDGCRCEASAHAPTPPPISSAVPPMSTRRRVIPVDAGGTTTVPSPDPPDTSGGVIGVDAAPVPDAGRVG